MFSFKQTSVLAVVAAGVGLASSQSLSSQCQSTLTQLVLSSNTQCLNAQALVALVTTDDNTSLVSPINNWLTGLCSQPACSNATLSTIVANVTSGCSTDLKTLGLGDISTSELTTIVQEAYPTVRQVLCLADTSNSSTLCATETLTNLQSSVGTLSKSNINTLVSDINNGNVPNVSSSVLCTDCNKEAFNIVRTNFPDLVSSNELSSVSQECGASFVDGATPSAVSQSATTATASPQSATTNSNDALSILSAFGGIVASSVIAVATGFTFIA